VKLNEFKKPKLNELDLSSFIGDYGSAGLRTGLGSMMGKNVLSTQDQMVKDQFVKNFTSRAFSGLQSGISSGLIDLNASGNPPVVTKPVTTKVNPPIANPKVTPVTTPAGGPTAGANAFGQMANQLTTAKQSPEAGANSFGQMANQLATTKKSPEQIRQEKQAAAAGVAQDQMSQNGQFSKLPTDQFNKTAANTRQQKQASATQTAQDQMSPMSKLPADQFNKTATNTRQQKQGVATQTAQDQMSPMSKLPTDQFNKSAANVRQKKQADAMKPVTKPDNQFKRNSKIKNSGKNAFGQMAQNLGKVAESSKFDKLNFLFENILSEATRSTQSISQYITNFFTQFMKGVTINDKAVVSRLKSLAIELEQT
jgi:hypothetical protein